VSYVRSVQEISIISLSFKSLRMPLPPSNTRIYVFLLLFGHTPPSSQIVVLFSVWTESVL
jgi:hypothetical protein